MAKQWYDVEGSVTVSARTYVLAESAEEAMTAASGRSGALAVNYSDIANDMHIQFVIEDADGEMTPVRASVLTDAALLSELADELEDEG